MDEVHGYIDLMELSKRLSVSPRTLRYWAHDPKVRLPAYRIRKHYKLLFRWTEVERWLQRHRVKPVDAKAKIKCRVRRRGGRCVRSHEVPATVRMPRR